MKNSIKVAALALVIATSFAACKGKSTSTTDSTKVDSTKVDSTKVDSSAKMTDTTKKMADTTKKKM
jgi:hypothetical protein